MEAISKQRFDAPAAVVATGAGGTARGRGGRTGLRCARQPTRDARARQHAAIAAALAAAVAQQQAQLAAQQLAQPPPPQQASGGPGGIAQAALPSTQQQQQGQQQQQQQQQQDVAQGSIQSGMAMVGLRRAAATGGPLPSMDGCTPAAAPRNWCWHAVPGCSCSRTAPQRCPSERAPPCCCPADSDSDGGSTRARGPTKRQRARRGSELSAGRGTSVEQQVRQQPSSLAGTGPGRPAAAAAGPSAAAADEVEPSRPGSRRRKRSASAAPTEEEARPRKRQQPAEPRRSGRSGLRSSGPAVGEGLPEPQRQPQRQQQPAGKRQQQPSRTAVAERQRGAQPQERKQQDGQQPEAPQQQQQVQGLPQEQQADGEEPDPWRLAAAKPADRYEASGSYYETAEAVMELEQAAPQPGPGGSGLLAAVNAVRRLFGFGR